MAGVTLAWAGLTIPPASSINRTAAGAAQRQIAAAGARSAIPFTYGRDRLGALMLNILPASAGSPTLLVQCLWGHAIDSIDEVRLNDLALPPGSAITHYGGQQTTADAALVAGFAAQGITYSDTLSGYAYSVFAMPTRAFDGQLNVSARIAGRRVYDPRADSTAGGSGSQRLADSATWAWSENPALALADFLRSPTYGCGEALDWASVATAANHSDAMIGTPAETRRRIGVSFVQPAPVAEIAETLRAYAGCWLVRYSGAIRLIPDEDSAPVAHLDHAAGNIAAIGALVTRDLGNAPTAVEVVYTDTAQVPWRDAAAVAQVPGAGTTLPWRLSTVRLPGIHRYGQALREATERLAKLRQAGLSTTLELFDGGIAFEPADIVQVSHPVGLVTMPMRITAVEMTGAGQWQLALTQHDSAAYSTLVASAASAPDAALVNPAGPPGTVAGFAATREPGSVRVRWTANAESDVTGYELRLGGTGWADSTPLDGTAPTIVGGTTHLWVHPGSGTYTLRIKARDAEGLESAAAASITFAVDALSVRDIDYTGDLDATRNVTYRQAPDPVSSPGGVVNGDIWLQLDGGGLVIATKHRVGGAWIDGPTGPAGLNNATVLIYRRAASTPAVPSGTVTYTFVGAGVSGLDNGWTVTVPSGTDPLYVTAAAASSSGPSDTIATGEWAAPVIQSRDGAAGAAGLNAATVYLFRRTTSATAPALPSASVTYTFSSGAATGLTEGWTQTLPTSGGAYRWVTTATALSTDSDDTIGTAEWAAAALLAEDGVDGAAGQDAARLEVSPAAASVQALLDGTVQSGGLDGAVFACKVFAGSSDVSASWTLSRTSGSGVTSSISGATVTTTALTVDTGTIDITATRSGWPTLTQRVTLTKVRSAPNAGPNAVFLASTSAAASSGTATARIRFRADGTVQFRANGGSWATADNWYSPTTSGVGSSPGYWMRASKTSEFGSGTFSGTLDQWLKLDTDREYTAARGPAEGVYGVSLLYRIASDAGGSNIVASVQGSVEAEIAL
jgi:hypothetical protein